VPIGCEIMVRLGEEKKGDNRLGETALAIGESRGQDQILALRFSVDTFVTRWIAVSIECFTVLSDHQSVSSKRLHSCASKVHFQSKIYGASFRRRKSWSSQRPNLVWIYAPPLVSRM